MRFADALALLESEKMTPPALREAFASILDGAWTSVQIGAFAAMMRSRANDAETLFAAAEALRSVMIAVEHGLDAVLDTCGTGGDGAHTLNISTVAAIVVAAAGVPVAKHGNRAISSKCGSADVVEALGIPLDLPPVRQAELLREVGIAFLMAPAHHPALAHAAGARRELGVRTLFNALGPVVNPARATHQLIGVYDDALRSVVAGTLARMGSRRAWVVRSEDGLDEISTAGVTRVTALEDGALIERTVTPEDFGLERVPLTALAGGDAATNARALLALLRGEPHPARAAVLLNAAAALHVARGGTLGESVAAAERVLDDGAALERLERWRERSLRIRREGT